MNKATLTVAVLMVGVVLAGCSGTDPAVTPAPVPTVEEGPVEGPLPPGISDSGISDADALLAAHTAAVARSDGRIVINRTVRRGNESGSLLRTARTTVDIGIDPDRIRLTQQLASPGFYANQTIEVYYGDDGQYGRYLNNGTRYERLDEVSQSAYRNQTAAYEVRSALRRGEWVPTGERRINGDQTVILRLVEATDGLENATGVMAITEDGAIKRLSVTTVGEFRWVTIDYRYDRLESNFVSHPPWLQKARNATG